MATRFHFFLVSSLPLLRLGSKPFYSSAEFMALCQPHVDTGEFKALGHARLVPCGEPQSRGERRWYEFEVYLRNRIAVSRATRLATDSRPWLRHEDDVFPGSNRQIEDALAATTPLARERALDALRWQRLDDLQAEQPFTLDALVMYRLQLLLAEKWAAPDAGRSRDALQQLVAATVNQGRTVCRQQPVAAGDN